MAFSDPRIIAAVAVSIALASGVVGYRIASADTARERQRNAELIQKSEHDALETERKYRQIEQDWQNKLNEVRRDAETKLSQIATDRDTAAAAAGELHEQVKRYAATACPATAATAAATGGPAAPNPAVVLADLFARADARAGELAEVADRRGAAGMTCVEASQ